MLQYLGCSVFGELIIYCNYSLWNLITWKSNLPEMISSNSYFQVLLYLELEGGGFHSLSDVPGIHRRENRDSVTSVTITQSSHCF